MLQQNTLLAERFNTVSDAQALANILDGKLCSQQVLDELVLSVEFAKASGNMLPKLVVVLVGENPASQVYVRKKVQTAQKLGMHSELLALPAHISQEALLEHLAKLNQDVSVHGVLVQLPLPGQISAEAVLMAIDPKKDVDGFHPVNAGKLFTGASQKDRFFPVPCTPAGVMVLLEKYSIPISGKHVVVIGRSNIVGKPMAQLLLQADATVTICHSKTENLSQVAASADILVTAIGIPHLVTSDWVRQGAVVVDVGINRLETGKLCGDVDFASVSQKASYITPVPGGVGPMTVAMLMYNTLKCYEAQLS